MIELACLSHNFNYLSFEDAARLVSQLGFANIDISASHCGGQSAMTADPSAAAATVRSVCERLSLHPRELFLFNIEVGGKTASGTDPDPSERQRLLDNFARICDFARAAGFHSILIAIGGAAEGQSQEEAEALANETLARQVALAAERDLVCNFEPGDRPEQVLQRCQAVPGLGLTLDYSHFVSKGYTFEEVLPLHAFTRHMHAKSASPTKAKAYFHNNEIDFAPIITDLKGRNWTGCIQIECMGFPKYKELGSQFQPLPEAPDPIGLPPFQTMALAYEMARLIQTRSES